MAAYTQEVHSVWRLKNEGSWNLLYQSPAHHASTQKMESIVEWIGNLCLEHFPQRSQWTSEVGDQSLLAYHDEQGVLMGLYPTGHNATLVRTAMQKIEQLKPSIKDLPRPPEVQSSSSKHPTLSLKPLTPSQDVIENREAEEEAQQAVGESSTRKPDSIDENEHIPSLGSQRSASDSLVSFTELPHTSLDDEEASLFETLQREDVQPLLPPVDSTPHPLLPSVELPPKELLRLAAPQESNPPASRELEENIVSLSHSQRGLPISMEFEPPSMTSLQQLPEAPSSLCLWRDVAEFIKQTIERTSPMLGQTVVANYWRKAFAPHSLLNDSVPINPLGEIKAPYPNRVVHDEIGHQLQTAYEHWIQRCSRVIRDFPAHVESLPTPPWKKFSV